MNVIRTSRNGISTLTRSLEIGRHLKRVRDAGLADPIGGFTEWAASIGYSRHHADRLIHMYERTNGGGAALETVHVCC